MILVKHFTDSPEADDGVRMWVEPVELVPELRSWCRVDHCLTHLGPPVVLRQWFEDHPLEYEEFRDRYHQHLAAGPYKRVLHDFAVAAAGQENVTLLHDEDDPTHTIPRRRWRNSCRSFIGEVKRFNCIECATKSADDPGASKIYL